jgi:hypothetical protein
LQAFISMQNPLVVIKDALEFFRLSAGRWRSQRTSHHLLHRRAEAGGSLIEVSMLSLDDSRLSAMANLHGQNPAAVVGGCHVRWGGSMAWDKHGEEHEGESMFALIPTDPEGTEGLMLRDRGYAETAPVAGVFRLDQNASLWLTTSYETMKSVERFWFVSPDIRMRTSTVEGLSNTASLCMETRLNSSTETAKPLASNDVFSSILGW